jgi:predicted AAA+ superfamily ATPase
MPRLGGRDSAVLRSLQATVSGEHLENLVCTDLLAWRDLQVVRPSILYWRTSVGEEVDFVVETKGKFHHLVITNVKISARSGAQPRAANCTEREAKRNLYESETLKSEGNWVPKSVHAICANLNVSLPRPMEI